MVRPMQSVKACLAERVMVHPAESVSDIRRRARAAALGVSMMGILCATSASATESAGTNPPDSLGVPRPPRLVEWNDTTVVRGSRLSRIDLLLRGTGFATWVDVREQRGPAEDAADLLERSVGLSVRRFGGPGATAGLSIRGMDPGHVEIFFDRVPLRTAARGLVDLHALDLAQIAGIEIHRSTPPADLGGEASGAAVRLVPHQASGTHLRFSASGGSFGTRALEACGSVVHRGLRALVTVSRHATEGGFTYDDDGGTPHETGDDGRRAWTNGDSRREALFVNAGQKLGTRWELSASSQLYRSDQGVPGTAHMPTLHARMETSGALNRAGIRWRHDGSRPLETELYGFLGTDERSFRDPDRELAVTGTRTRVDQEQKRDGVGLHVRATLSAPGGLGLHLPELLLERRNETLRNVPLADRPEEDRRRRSGELLSVGNRWDLQGGRIGLEGFYRWERSTNNYTGASPWRPFASQPTHVTRHEGPRFGLRWDVGAGWTLKANHGRFARFPTFTELFGYAGTIQGNATLQPEQGRRWDAGGSWIPSSRPLGMRVSAEASYYRTTLEQMIVMITISDRETKPMNIDRAQVQGVELAFTVDHVPLLHSLRLAGAGRGDASLSGHAEWQESRDEGRSPVYNGKELTYHPRWRASLALEVKQGCFELRHHARYQDAVFWARSNLPEFRSAAFWEHDLMMRWHVHTDRLALSLRIENLFDARREDLRGYPLPGRAWYGGIDVGL